MLFNIFDQEDIETFQDNNYLLDCHGHNMCSFEQNFDNKDFELILAYELNINKDKIEEENTTSNKTNIKNVYYNDCEKTIYNEVRNGCPPFLTINEIINIMNKGIINVEIKNKFLEGKTFVEKSEGYEYMMLTRKKRKREEKTSKNFYIIVENKRGRKTNLTNRKYIHDKHKSDNIIKKIKAKLFKSALIFMNNILNMNEDNKLLKLDYKYVNKLKREDDLNLLNMSLKNFFSQDISSKYNVNEKKPYHNKTIINNIINDIISKKKENFINQEEKEYNTIMFIFNITFGDFVDICTFKKTIEDLLNDYKINKNDINYMRIKDNIIGINEIATDVINKNDGNYFSFFIFYLYNYKRWFYLKKGKYNSIEQKK